MRSQASFAVAVRLGSSGSPAVRAGLADEPGLQAEVKRLYDRCATERGGLCEVPSWAW